jgi:hypothetical protein
MRHYVRDPEDMRPDLRACLPLSAAIILTIVAIILTIAFVE